MKLIQLQFKKIEENIATDVKIYKTDIDNKLIGETVLTPNAFACGILFK